MDGACLNYSIMVCKNHHKVTTKITKFYGDTYFVKLSLSIENISDNERGPDYMPTKIDQKMGQRKCVEMIMRVYQLLPV